MGEGENEELSAPLHSSSGLSFQGKIPGSSLFNPFRVPSSCTNRYTQNTKSLPKSGVATLTECLKNCRITLPSGRSKRRVCCLVTSFVNLGLHQSNRRIPSPLKELQSAQYGTRRPGCLSSLTLAILKMVCVIYITPSQTLRLLLTVTSLLSTAERLPLQK